ncbi:uncharacterized protein LOC6582960 [Drosophila mojavensis]|uniref:Kazal-like domain-containing protein n=1 Tax=Drosophila mojavensis TaxID=7230 RepID=B4L0E8_DROMO|nr:uncharacterized protein LOC6582960 [Drosophila mojavensis]EDW19117.1 uncharacterized protein Dmoj_GI11700 [Drosophila mojavensis]
MRALLIFALLALTQAAQLDKQEPNELPAHVQTLITNHINQVLAQKPHGQVATLTGHVPQAGAAANKGNDVAVPHLDLLPPHVEPTKLPQVINHRATATWQHAAGYNKVVMPPVAEIVVSVPGQAPLDIGDKVSKVQQKVAYVMQQAQTHIPQAINQAIKERQKLEAQKHKQGSTTSSSTSTSTSTTTTSTTTNKPAHHAARLLSEVEEVPKLLDHQLELKKLGKCNYQCPEKSLPVCASNGNCVVEFAGQCELSEWNCFNTKNVFTQVHDDECNKTIKCYDRDNA